MSEYLSVEAGKQAQGLRLVLTKGVPGPWSEAAKALFHVKKISYQRVAQMGGLENDDLRAWTGFDNAPQAVYQDERARIGWSEIILLAERLAAAPPLIPEDAERRALMFGLLHEIAGEDGLGWVRRLSLLAPAMKSPDALPRPMFEVMSRLADKYGYSERAADAAVPRAVEILGLLDRQLAASRAAGQRYLMGAELSALDLYWATFAALIQPLPPELCPMPEGLRASYTASEPEVVRAATPELLAHRDFVYEQHLALPMDF